MKEYPYRAGSGENEVRGKIKASDIYVATAKLREEYPTGCLTVFNPDHCETGN